MSKINQVNYDHISNTLTGFFNQELNISYLNDIVLAALQHRRKKQEFALKETALRAGKLFNAESVSLNDGFSILGNAAQVLFSNNMFAEAEYKESTNKLISLIQTQETSNKKLHYIDLYMRILRKYMNVNIIYNEPATSTDICQQCGMNLMDYQSFSSEGCAGCGIVTRRFIKSSGNLDNDLDSFSPKSPSPKSDVKTEYNILFEKKLLRNQCRYSILPADNIVSTIKDYFRERNINPTLTLAHRLDNIKLMRKTLTILRYSKYKDDLNYFCHEIWGFPTPNRAHLDEQILHDFELVQPIITSIMTSTQNKKDVLVINSWRLWRHYIQVGLYLDPQEFDIPKTKDIVFGYESVWRKVCEQLGWNMQYKLTNNLNEWYAVEDK